MKIEVPCSHERCYQHVMVSLGTVLVNARCPDHIHGEFRGRLIKEATT